MTDAFLSAYFKNLISLKNKYPAQYSWAGNTDVLQVFRRASESFRKGHYSTHCRAVKMTCKELGIECTRTAIDAIFKENQDATGETVQAS